MDNNGTGIPYIAGIVDTGGNEDSIIHATTADVAKPPVPSAAPTWSNTP